MKTLAPLALSTAVHRRAARATLVALALLASCRNEIRTPRPPEDDAAPPGIAVSAACQAAPPITLADAPEAAEGAWSAVALPEPPECFAMRAEEAGPSGVAPTSAFVLESAEPFDLARLAEIVIIEPPLDFSATEEVRAAGSRRGGRVLAAERPYHYRIQLGEPLAQGAAIRFRLLAEPEGRPVESWAFQAAAPLRIVASLPADQATDVPIDAGIELTFSHAVADPDGLITVAPSVSGTVELRGSTIVFVPSALEPETIYAVTVDGALAAADGSRALEAPYVLTFETGRTRRGEAGADDRGPAVVFASKLWDVPEGEAPVVAVQGQREATELAGAAVSIGLWRYPEQATLLDDLAALSAIPSWTWHARTGWRADTSRLEPAGTQTATLEAVGEFGEYAIRLGEPFEPGAYLVEIAPTDAALDPERRSSQAWLQVTDVAAYVAVSGSRTLVWANDAGTGEALAGAAVSAAGEAAVAATTGADGAAFFDTPDALIAAPGHDLAPSTSTTAPPAAVEIAGVVEVTAEDGRRSLVPLSSALRPRRGFFEWLGERRGGSYASYLYTDRALYRMSDTVRFFAVLVPRHGAPPPETAVVDLVGWTTEGEATLASARVWPGPAGTILGELAFAGAAPSYYTLRLRVDAETLASTSVEVRDFVKPAYALDVVPARRAVLVGQPLTATVRARFFEGSPVPRLGIAAETNGVAETLITDAAGEAIWSVPITVPQGDVASAYEPQYLSARPSRGEEGDVGGGAMVYAFPAAAATHSFGRVVDGVGEVTGTVHAVDLDLMEAAEVADPEDALADPLGDWPVSATVKATRWEAIPTGERYDFVRKAVVSTFRYEAVEEAVGTFDAVSGADGSFAIAFPAESGVGYVATVSVADDEGRRSGRTVWLGEFETPEDGVIGLEADDEDDQYAVGERVALRLTASDPELLAGGRNLFFRASAGLRDFDVTEETDYAFPFADADIPNVVVSAVHFTGRTYLEVPFGYNARLDTSDRRLDVAIEAGAPRYAPGDEATLTVRVTDADGEPVADAEVLLSAIDAAIVRIQGFRGDDPLDALYRSVASGILGTAASHKQPSASAGAEGGGGGGDAREDLRDTALFEQATTDDDGLAEVTFTVPDDLTSWAVRGIAVTEDVSAGAGDGSVPVGLPLFVDATLPPTLLAGDQAVLRLRAFGTALDDGDPVAFEVEGDGIDAPLSAEGEAFEGVDVPLGALPAGRLSLRFTAAAGELADTLVRPIQVLPSRLVAAESTSVVLGEGEAVLPEPAGPGRVHLTLADRGRGRYYPDLAALAWRSGDRLDQQLARAVARDVLASAYGEPIEDAFRPSVYQVAPSPDGVEGTGAVADAGGLALLPYGSAELPLSALAAAAAPAAFARAPLAAYFHRIAADPDETPERVATALWGLASLGEPVHQSVQAASAAAPADPVVRLTLGLAAAALGDDAEARRALSAVLEASGEARGAQARVAAAAGERVMLAATWRAALLAAALSEPLAPALYDYVVANADPEQVDDLNRAAFVKRLLPNLAAGESEIAYTVEGDRVERRLAPGEVVSLDLSPDQLADLALDVADGALVATLTSLAPIDLTTQSSADLSIARAYAVRPPGSGPDEPAGDGDVELADGDLVVVTLTPQLGPGTDRGCHQVSDLLPSGLQAVTQVLNPLAFYGEDNDIDHPHRIDGQRVSFCAYRGDEPVAPIRYLARVVSKGTYRAEPPVIQSLQTPGDLAVGEAATVVVR